MREGEKAVALVPISQDALFGRFAAVDLAAIYAQVGETERALNALERLMSIRGAGGWVRGYLLRIDPRWDRLRGVWRLGLDP